MARRCPQEADKSAVAANKSGPTFYCRMISLKFIIGGGCDKFGPYGSPGRMARTRKSQTFGDNACHPEPFASLKSKLHEGSGLTDAEILRFAQDDSQDTTQIRSREALSPNVCRNHRSLAHRTSCAILVGNNIHIRPVPPRGHNAVSVRHPVICGKTIQTCATEDHR